MLYACAVGVTSSRAIERRCVDDLAFRVITADRQPDHATTARFLVCHREALSDVFFGVLELCERAGMAKVGVVAVDSTKLGANAALEQNRTFEGLRREAQRIIEETIETDCREDELYGQRRRDELPGELADPKTRKARIKRELLEQARAEREAAQADREQLIAGHEQHLARTGKRKQGRPPKPERQVNRDQDRWLTKKYNVTDPDSVIVRHRGLLMQRYNIQAAVADGQVILAARATSASPDGGQLEPMIDLAQNNLARINQPDRIEQVLADTGYWHTGQITRLSERGIRVLVSPYATTTGDGARQMRDRLDRNRTDLQSILI